MDSAQCQPVERETTKHPHATFAAIIAACFVSAAISVIATAKVVLGLVQLLR